MSVQQKITMSDVLPRCVTPTTNELRTIYIYIQVQLHYVKHLQTQICLLKHSHFSISNTLQVCFPAKDRSYSVFLKYIAFRWACVCVTIYLSNYTCRYSLTAHIVSKAIVRTLLNVQNIYKKSCVSVYYNFQTAT